MINRNKKKAIVEWFNCLSSDYPIESLAHLKDGSHFYSVAKKINPSEDKEVESADERYSYVEKCINAFFQTECGVLIDFRACQRGVELELGKVAVLLLSAVVHLTLTSSDSQLVSLTQLDQRVQEDIQECLSSVFLKSSGWPPVLAPDFAVVLTQQTLYGASSPNNESSTSSPYKTPKRYTSTRRRGRKRTPHNIPTAGESPLKMLLDSPQIQQQVAMREKQEILRLRKLLNEAENRCSELLYEEANFKSTADKQDKEIAELKEKVNELRKYRDIAEELTACQGAKGDAAAAETGKLTDRCGNCTTLQRNIKNLDGEYRSLNEELVEKMSRVETLERHNSEILQQTETLKQRIRDVEGHSDTLQQQVINLERQLASSQQSAEINKSKLEEALNEAKRLQQSPCHLCEQHMDFDRESMEIVPEKKIVELQRVIEDQQGTINNLKTEVANQNANIITLVNEKSKLSKDCEKLEQEKKHLTSLQNKVNILSAKLEDECIKSGAFEQEKSAIERKYNNLTVAYEKVLRENELCNKSNKTYSTKNFELQQHIEVITRDKEVLEEDVKRLLQENTNLNNDMEVIKNDNKNLRDLMESYEKQISQTEINFQKAEAECRSLSHEVSSLRAEKDTLLSEIKYLSDNLREKDATFLNLKTSTEEEAKQLRNELEVINKAQNTQKSFIAELEKANEAVSNDVCRLTKQIKEKDEQFLSYKNVKEAEIVDLKSRISKLSDDSECQVVSINELKNDYNLAGAKITELSQCLVVKDAELLNIRNSNKEEVEKLHTQLEEKTIEWENAVSQNKSIVEKLEKLLNQLEHLEHVRNDLREEEAKNKQLDVANEALRKENAIYVMEADSSRNMVKELKEENANLKREVENLQKIQEEVDGAKSEVETTNVHQKEKLITLEKENLFLRTCIKENKDELTKLTEEKANNDHLTQQLKNDKERLTDEVKYLSDAMASKRRMYEARLVELNQEKEDSISALRSVENRSSELIVEIEKLRAEVSSVQLESKKNLEQVAILVKEKEELLSRISRLNDKNSEIDSMHAEISVLKNENKDLSSRCSNLQSEKEKLLAELKQMLSQKDQLNALNSMVLQLQQEKEEIIKNYEASNTQLLTQVSELKQEISELKSALEKSETDITCLRSTLEDEECSFNKKKEEYDACMTQFSEISARNEELKISLAAVEANNCKLNSQLQEVTLSLEKFRAEHSATVSRLAQMEEECEKHKSEKLEVEKSLTELEQKMSSLNSCNDIKVECLDAEKESLMEKVENLERNLRAVRDSKELVEKEYYMCIEEKDQSITNLENQISDLKNTIKAESDHNADRLEKLQVQFNDIQQKLKDEVKKNSDLSRKVAEIAKNKDALFLENKRYKSEKEKWKSEMEKMNSEMECLSERVASSNIHHEQALKEQQHQVDKFKTKYERAKEIIENLEKDKKEREKLLKNYSEKIENLRAKAESKRAEENLREELQVLSNSNNELREELQQTRLSLVPLQDKVKHLETSNKKMKQENLSLSAQLQLADSQLRKLNKQAHKNEDHSVAAKRFAFSLPIRSPLRSKSEKNSKPKLEKNSHIVKDKKPILLRKNTSTKNVSETYLLKDASPEVNGSFNGSIASEGFNNHSVLGSSSRFLCDDEEEFLNHRSLSNIKSSTVTSSPQGRISELQRRNTLCLPHMRSSYPVETQMQPSVYVSDDSIREGSRAHKQTLEKNKRFTIGGNSKKAEAPKRKRDESDENISLKLTKSEQLVKAAVEKTPNKKLKNPFPSPGSSSYSSIFDYTTPTSLKKMASRLSKPYKPTFFKFS